MLRAQNPDHTWRCQLEGVSDIGNFSGLFTVSAPEIVD
jgi:hypothetical protein